MLFVARSCVTFDAPGVLSVASLKLRMRRENMPAMEELLLRPVCSRQSRTRISRADLLRTNGGEDRSAQESHFARHAIRYPGVRPEFGELGIRLIVNDVKQWGFACLPIIEHGGLQIVVWIDEHREDSVLILFAGLDVEINIAQEQVFGPANRQQRWDFRPAPARPAGLSPGPRGLGPTTGGIPGAVVPVSGTRPGAGPPPG